MKLTNIHCLTLDLKCFVRQHTGNNIGRFHVMLMTALIIKVNFASFVHSYYTHTYIVSA